MEIMQLEKEINDRHYRNDPVIKGILSLLKKQDKEINNLKSTMNLMIKCNLSGGLSE